MRLTDSSTSQSEYTEKTYIPELNWPRDAGRGCKSTYSFLMGTIRWLTKTETFLLHTFKLEVLQQGRWMSPCLSWTLARPNLLQVNFQVCIVFDKRTQPHTCYGSRPPREVAHPGASRPSEMRRVIGRRAAGNDVRSTLVA